MKMENNKIYLDNIDAYEREFPGNLAEIEAKKLDNSNIKAVTVEGTKDNKYTIKTVINDKSIYTNSKYNAMEEARRFVEKLVNYDKDTVFIIYGLGLGYHVRMLQEKLKGDNNIILVIEPELQIFHAAMQTEYMVDIIQEPNTVIAVGRDLAQVHDVLSDIITISKLDNFQYLTFSQYEKIDKDYYLQVYEEIKNVIASLRVLVSTITHFAYDFNRNFLNNFPILVDNYKIQNIKNKYKNIPAFIVSAGPSLDKNIEQLKRVGNKGLIIANGRTIKPLVDKGIEPDYVVSIDPGIGSAYTFRDKADTTVPLVTTIISNDTMISKHQGHKLFINISDFKDLVKHLTDNDIEEVHQGGSVANTSLSIADYMGCNPIIFVGQDLAFTDNLRHADSTKNNPDYKPNEISKGDLKVPDIYGNEINTNWQMYTFIKWFEDYVRVFPDKTYIDATEGGAMIVGTEIMTLNDAIDTQCHIIYDLKDINGQVFKEKLNTDINSVYEKFMQMSKDLAMLKSNSNKALNLNEKALTFYERNSKMNINKLNKWIAKLEKEILKNQKNNLVINRVIQPVLVKLEMNKAFKGKQNETDKELGIRVAKYSIELYKNIVKSVEKIEPLIEANLQILKEKAEVK